MGTLGLAILGGVIGFLIGSKIYYNAEHEKTMDSFSQYIKKRKLESQKNRRTLKLVDGE